jgi:hypothetical protein
LRYFKENVRPAIETTQNDPRRDRRRCEQQPHKCACFTTIASNPQTIISIPHAIESGALKSGSTISCVSSIADAKSAATTAGHIVWVTGSESSTTIVDDKHGIFSAESVVAITEKGRGYYGCSAAGFCCATAQDIEED